MTRCSDQSVREILEYLQILTTPVARNVKKSSLTATEEFDNLLLGNVHLLNQRLNSASVSDFPYRATLRQETTVSTTAHVDIRWTFTSICLYLLLLLQQHLVVLNREFQEQTTQDLPTKKSPHQEPPLSPDVLSIEQEKTTLTALQFIVCLGICQNLDKGVGIPLERRSGFGSLVGNKSNDLSREDRYARLTVCGRVLLACLDVPTLGALVLSKHLCDLLAVLLQVNHGSESLEKTNSISDKNLQECEPSRHSGTQNDGASEIASEAEDDHQSSDITSPQEGSVTSASCRLHPEDLCPLKGDNMRTEDNIPSLTTTETETSCLYLLDELNIKDSDQAFAEAAVDRLMTRVRPAVMVRDLIMLQGGAGPKTKSKVKGRPLAVSPHWLRHVCGEMMTAILMKTRGLLHVFQGMLPPSVGSKGIGDWLKCQAIAMVIAHCPLTVTSVEEYYKHICSEILYLLHHRDTNIALHYLRVITTLMKEMTNQHPQLVQRHLLEPLFSPLQLCTQNSELSAGTIVVTEQKMTLCIEDLIKVYVRSTETQECVWPELSRHLPVVFHLYSCTKSGVSHLRKPCEDLLVTGLKRADTDVCLDYLWLFATGIHGNSVKDVAHMSSRLAFRSGETGGMSAVTIETTNSASDVSLDAIVGSLVELVKNLQDSGVAGEFLIKLLQELTEMVSCESSTDVKKSTFLGHEKDLLILEQEDTQDVELFNRRLIVLNLLASICEELGPSCIKKTQHILSFVKATLGRGVLVCRATTDELTGLFESETLTMAMGLLTAVMGGAVEVDASDQETMQELLPLLDEIRREHESEEVKEMADDLRIAIATRGAVWSELLKKKKADVNKPSSKVKVINPETNSEKPLIEILSETSADDAVLETDATALPLPFSVSPTSPVNTHGESIQNVEDHKISKLEQAFQELCDPEIPVRGHGLLQLTHLVKVKDASAMDMAETLVKIFEENLQHSDSYLYLASVNGLAELADKWPDIVVPRLTREFADFDSGPRKKSAEVRVKLGESLVKTAKYLGDMVPKYRDLLLSAILSGARSDDALVRASSLSNLAEVCRLLRFSLGNVLHEVVLCCSSVMKTDPDPDARKAATLTITQTLQGLGSDSLTVLEGVVKDLYRVLKQVHTSDPDDMVRSHALLALNELDTIMRAALFPTQRLQKKISILHPE